MCKKCDNCEYFIPKSKAAPYNAFDYIAGNKVGVCNEGVDVEPLMSIKKNCDNWVKKKSNKDFKCKIEFCSESLLPPLDNMGNTEIIELMYLNLKGFKYIVRNEIGSVEVFVNKPHRKISTTAAYSTWVERDYPMTHEEMKRRRDVELGEYDFITWNDEPILISDLINKYQIVEKINS